MDPQLKSALTAVAVLLGGAFLIGLVLILWLYRRLRKLELPQGAGFFTTMRAVPLALAVALDLMDLGLDMFSAPIVWWLLDRLKLGKLRTIATAQALVPFSGPIPVLTLGWLGARFLKLGDAPGEGVIETERVAPGTYAARRDRD